MRYYNEPIHTCLICLVALDVTSPNAATSTATTETETSEPTTTVKDSRALLRTAHIMSHSATAKDSNIDELKSELVKKGLIITDPDPDSSRNTSTSSSSSGSYSYSSSSSSSVSSSEQVRSRRKMSSSSSKTVRAPVEEQKDPNAQSPLKGILKKY